MDETEEDIVTLRKEQFWKALYSIDTTEFGIEIDRIPHS